MKRDGCQRPRKIDTAKWAKAVTSVFNGQEPARRGAMPDIFEPVVSTPKRTRYRDSAAIT